MRPRSLPRLAVPPGVLTRGRGGRYLSDTALSGTLPSEIGQQLLLKDLCARAAFPVWPFPRVLTRGRGGRWLYNTALSGTLPSEIGQLRMENL
eukprot:COSAG01_NODE_19536_length_1004_cov_1.928177_2_plen_93_part_00